MANATLTKGECANAAKTIRHAARRAGKKMIEHIGVQRYKLLYLRQGKEVRGPWFYNRSRARQALQMMQAKYGEANCILYVD